MFYSVSRQIGTSPLTDPDTISVSFTLLTQLRENMHLYLQMCHVNDKSMGQQ